MTAAADWITGGGMPGMGHLDTFTIRRARLVADPYNPDRTVDSGEYDEHAAQAYLSSASSLELAGEVRCQADSTAQLIIPDPSADVRRGDLVVAGGHTWTVTGFPAADTNPFTGWRPTLVASLEEVTG